MGRTGAGKSSLLQAIFRFVETSGSIRIDGQDISEIELPILRKSIALIPQSAFLFEASVRDNLDPFHDYSDEAIWNALQDVELFYKVREFENGLNTQVEEGLFSVGEKQLMSLARAILK